MRDPDPYRSLLRAVLEDEDTSTGDIELRVGCGVPTARRGLAWLEARGLVVKTAQKNGFTSSWRRTPGGTDHLKKGSAHSR